MPRFLVEGFGVLDERTSFRQGEKSAKCPHHTVWLSMLIRCYSEKNRHKYKTYEGCTVDERWRLFSEFKKWREAQDWKGKQLDKDLLVPGNRVYGPDTCTMLDRSLNTFLVRQGHPDLMEGVIYSQPAGKYKPIRYTNPFTLGRERQADTVFEEEVEAHAQWLKNKHEMALIYAKREKDPRVIKALTTRWAKAEQY